MTPKAVPWRRLTAEGAMIVAGVLIALAADRWVQRLDASELERDYLVQMLDEVVQADSILEYAASHAIGRQTRAAIIVAALNGTLPDSIHARDLTLALSLAHWLLDPEIPRNTWQDLIATGRLALITSPDIRRTLAEFYRAVDQQSEFHAEWLGYVLPYRRAVSAIISPELQLAVAQHAIDGNELGGDVIPDRSSLLSAIRSNAQLRSSVGEVLTVNWAAD